MLACPASLACGTSSTPAWLSTASSQNHSHPLAPQAWQPISHPSAMQAWQTQSDLFASQVQQTHSCHPLALQARQQAATAQAAADACRKELGQAEAQARDQQAGLQGRAEALLEALRSLVRLALRSAAAMQAATQAMWAAGGHGKRQQPEAVRAFSAPGLCGCVWPFAPSCTSQTGQTHNQLRAVESCCLCRTLHLCQPLLSFQQCVWTLA